MNDLEKSILKTVIYFDIFNCPLTCFEIWEYLIDYKCKLQEVIFCLSGSENIKRYTETSSGFFYLKGKKEIIKFRKINRLNSQYKIKLAIKKASFIRYVPFVRCVCLSGSIPHFNSQKNSDIDLFIIIKDEYIWFSRFFITLFSHIFRVRRHGKKIKNRLCLNFYLSDEHLNLEDLCYENELWFFFWFTQIFPIIGKTNYSKFLQFNQWALKRIPNFIKFDNVSSGFVNKKSIPRIKRFLELILDNEIGLFFDVILRELQLFKMRFNKNSKMNNGEKDVIVNDYMLKFHEADPRKYYNKIFLEKTKFLSK